MATRNGKETSDDLTMPRNKKCMWQCLRCVVRGVACLSLWNEGPDLTAMRLEVTRDARDEVALYNWYTCVCGDILVFTLGICHLFTLGEHQLYTRSRFDDSDSRLYRRPPQSRRGHPRHTHTHTILRVVRRVYIAPRPSGFAPPCPSPRSLSGWLRRHSPDQNPPHTPPHHSSPPESACASGAGVATPTVCTPEWSGKYGRHGACVARSCGHDRRSVARFPFPPLSVRVRGRTRRTRAEFCSARSHRTAAHGGRYKVEKIGGRGEHKAASARDHVGNQCATAHGSERNIIGSHRAQRMAAGTK